MPAYAITDIHGCIETFKELVHSKLILKRTDTLYLLGDYINKGPGSKDVLDYILLLQERGYRIVCLRGNHDQMLLDIQLVNTYQTWKKEIQKLNTLKSFKVEKPQDIPEKYITFLKSMHYFVEIEKFFLVHAGFFFGINNPFLDKISMLWIKDFKVDKNELKGKSVIHGHVPQTGNSIINKKYHQEPAINIDGGCVYYKNKDYGSLVALNIDNLKVVLQSNIDFPYNIEIRQ